MRWVHGSAITIGLVLAFSWAVMVVGMWWMQGRMVYYPHAQIGAPADYDLAGVTSWTLETPDGETLQVWSAPATPGQPTIAYFHGNAGNLSHRASAFRDLTDQGLGVVAMSYRGYGESTGHPSAQALHADAHLLLDHMNTQMGIPDAMIVAHGESLGTGLATDVAAVRDLRGLILQAPYTSTIDVARSAAPLVPVSLLFTERYDNLSKIGDVSAPVLILHGADDTLFPSEMSRRIGAAAKLPVAPIIIPGAGHVLDPSLTAPHIKAFLNKL